MIRVEPHLIIPVRSDDYRIMRYTDVTLTISTVCLLDVTHELERALTCDYCFVIRADFHSTPNQLPSTLLCTETAPVMPPPMKSEDDAEVAVTEQADANKVVVESRVKTTAVFSGLDEWPYQIRTEELCKEREGGRVKLRGIMAYLTYTQRHAQNAI